jgi:hypothetical protein
MGGWWGDFNTKRVKAGNLTEGFAGRLDGGVRPVAEEQKGGGEALAVGWYRHGEVE